MSTLVKPGTRYKSTVCDTEVIVVKPPAAAVDLRCGGHPVIEVGAEAPAGLTLDPAFSAGTPLGKRFADPESGLELLCTKAGAGSLSIGDVPLPLKDAKPLPSSD
ncbi:hypothetical protein MXD62_14250 [Frankia sp. Mgl5]|uniref:Uncharacterized protein n=1 Tax=Parafrankia soli TaxID=2599596 RepID=A0A1S1Q4A5_9ACTN|nr:MULTISPECIES: hypothetical protein [Frankiaceae]CAI7974928.1 conserved hypothetical protein [Frankia sp. Hr75.2]MCK9928321.1 hypothetical protein [Frankia sp. Mgl5]OHV28399.1 hypothetical protein BBK14_03675 [Parafrankia soli]TCJ33097.1 hypothetical protein E0504_39710 [Parafrankia sp. BMG5.11]SQD94039.1 conserved hypothetical protein [Parafrankia sp. Ea1.12]